ncbi:MAG: glutamyl-tRNA reductase [Micrococcales bacterium]
MALIFVGTDYARVPLSLLGALEPQVVTVLDELTRRLPVGAGAVILSTCNRFEAYIDTELGLPAALDALAESVCSTLGLEGESFRDSLVTARDESAVRHLLEVTAGLHSMVKGENEVRGQVRSAHALAIRKAVSSKFLDELFRFAVNTGRQVANKTSLLSSGGNLVSIGLERLQALGLNIEDSKCLILGTGGYAKIVVSTLDRYALEDISVHSPSGRAAQFALHNGLREVRSGDLETAISSCSLIITASGVNGHYLLPEMFESGQSGERQSKATYILDLAPARDVHPDVGGIPGVVLVDLEQLSLIAPEAQLEELRAAQDIVDRAAEKFTLDQLAKLAEPGIIALRESLGKIVDQELSTVRKNLDGDLAEILEQSLKRISNAFLHTPTVRGKKMAQSGKVREYEAAVKMLFEPPVNKK